MRRVLSLCALFALASPVALAQEPAPPAPKPAPPPSAEQAPAPPAGGDDKAGEEKKPGGPVGGYSWSDKPKKRWVRRATPKKLDPNAPLATYPGFRMLPGGKSAVWLYINKKVPVDVRRAAGRVVYVLPGVQVGTVNNTRPLLTHFFETPLARAQLRPEKGGAELVLELRENVQPTHRVVDGPRGTMILQVELPRATRSHTMPVTPSRSRSQKSR